MSTILKSFSLLVICVALCLCLHRDSLKERQGNPPGAGSLVTPRGDHRREVSRWAPRALTPEEWLVWPHPSPQPPRCGHWDVTAGAQGHGPGGTAEKPGDFPGVHFINLQASSVTSLFLKGLTCCWVCHLPQGWAVFHGAWVLKQ